MLIGGYFLAVSRTFDALPAFPVRNFGYLQSATAFIDFWHFAPVRLLYLCCTVSVLEGNLRGTKFACSIDKANC